MLVERNAGEKPLLAQLDAPKLQEGLTDVPALVEASEQCVELPIEVGL